MARRLRSLFLILMVAIAAPEALLAQDPAVGPSSKAQDIRRLLELTGGARMGEQILDQMLSLQQRALPQVPAAVWGELRGAFDTGELMTIIAAIWDKHFTRDDILGLIAFYESPIGLKLREVQPLILQESMAAGQAWGMRAVEKLMDKLKQKGYSATA